MGILIELWEGIKIAVSALWVNKLRAFLTLLGMIIGVTTVIGIFSLTQGLDQAFSEEISSLGSDILYVQKFPWMNNDNLDEYRNRKDITMREVRALKKYCKFAVAVSPSVATRRTVKRGNKSLKGVTINGTDQEKTSSAFPEFGRDLSIVDVNNRRNVCVIGWEVANRLFENEDPLGQKIKLAGHSFRIIGILEKRGDIFGQNQDTEIKIPIGVFFKLFGSRRGLTISVKVAHAEVMDAAKDEIRGILRRIRKVPPHKDDDFAINQMDLIMNMYNSLTGALYAAIIGVGAISLLVGGIGIMNIMLVSVTERTKEIGIRKALGAKRRNLLWQFLIESITISGIGGLIGIACGFGLGAMIAAVSPLPSTVSIGSIILGVGFSSAVGIFFGLYPASKAARLNPIDALHYE
ncbi:ABC transporter permease [bacterium]|nr:ABC transporter permease [bacterium]